MYFESGICLARYSQHRHRMNNQMKLLIPPPRRQAVERCPTDKQVFKSSWYSTLCLCLKDLNYNNRITTEISVWQVLHGAQCILLSFFGQACYQTGLVCDTGTGRKKGAQKAPCHREVPKTAFAQQDGR